MNSKTPCLDSLFLELSVKVDVKTSKEIALEKENIELKERLFDPKQRDIAVDALRQAVRSSWFINGADWRNCIDKEIFDVIGINQIDDLYK